MKKRRVHPPGGRRGLQSTTIEPRFWANVDKNGPVFEDKGPCWLWKGFVNNKGYGMIWTGGKPYQQLAHRVSLRLHGIEPPPGCYPKAADLVVDHMCKVILCVNPWHMQIVTQGENVGRLAHRPRATHCKRGHEFTPENTKVRNAKGHRLCITCKREWLRQRTNHQTD